MSPIDGKFLHSLDVEGLLKKTAIVSEPIKFSQAFAGQKFPEPFRNYKFCALTKVNIAVAGDGTGGLCAVLKIVKVSG
jgi:hypothetical protein